MWRYVDLSKYLSMLTTTALWFSRADMLGDRFEGSTTIPTRAAMRAGLEEPVDGVPALGAIEVEAIMSMTSVTNRRMTRWTYVSCWHRSDWESAAMWRLYRAGHGIAIETTYERMVRAIGGAELMHLGAVRYVDYEDHLITSGPWLNSFDPFLRKRSSFEHEREVRAIFSAISAYLPLAPGETRTPEEAEELLEAGGPAGIAVPTDISMLVGRVRVDPEAPTWFAEVVANVTDRFGYQYPVEQSDLATDPLF